MGRILLIDDDEALLDVVCMALEDAGHTCLKARDGGEGMQLIRAERPEVVISDVNMPGIDGFQLCRRLREQGNAVPFVLLTSRDSDIDEALGLDLGADDYVSKPFNSRVLISRITALLRRQRGAEDTNTPTCEVGELHLDLDRMLVSVAGTAVRVTVTEFRVLATLAERPGIVFSRERILDKARGDDSVVAPRLVDTYVRALRRKLEAAQPGYDGIETVVGAGYRLRAP